MGEAVYVAWPEDKASSQLEGVLSEFVLRMSGGFGACARLGIVSSQQVQQVCAFKLHGIVNFALFVNEQREGNAGLLAKSASVDAISEPHGG